MRISDWSSDVCSSDLVGRQRHRRRERAAPARRDAMTETRADDRDALIDAARDAASRAYAPYSGFHVGAALLLKNGDVVTGANVENASYGLTLCAETAVIAKIANEGWIGELAEVAIVGGRPAGDARPGSDPVTPCGRCRQILNEAEIGRAHV